MYELIINAFATRRFRFFLDQFLLEYINQGAKHLTSQ